MEKYACSACGWEATADRMWNIDRQKTQGKLVVICGRDAAEARKHGLKAYRLSETLKRDAERLARRNQFFAAFSKAKTDKAQREAKADHPHASTQATQVASPPKFLIFKDFGGARRVSKRLQEAQRTSRIKP